MIIRLAIVLGLLLPLGLPIVGWVPMILGLCVSFLALCSQAQSASCHYGLDNYPARLAAALVCAGLAIAWSAWLGARWHDSQVSRACLGSETQRVGLVSSVPQHFTLSDGTTGQRFIAQFDRDEANRCTFPRRLALSYYLQQPILALGDRVSMQVTLRSLSSQSNLGQLPDQARNAASGLHGRGTVDHLHIISRAPRYSIASLRNQFISDLWALHGSRRVIAIMQALLLGVGHDVLPSDWRNFKMLGLAHVMVISGLHIGLVFLMVRVLGLAVLGVTPLHRISVHRLSSILAILAATTYAAAAGMSVPATRALCMVLMTQIPLFMGWRSRPLWILMASLLVLLAANPFSALSSSLWLTIGATYAVLRLSEALARFSWWLRVLALQLLMTLFMAPLTAFWFGSVSFWGVIGNATVTPLVTMVAIPLLLTGALQDVVMGDSANYFWWLCVIVLRVTLGLLEWMAHALPHQGFVSLPLSPYQFAALALASILLFWRRRNLKFCGALVAAVAVFWALATRPMSGPRLQLLDVGQGTAIVFSEGAATLLYDTGAPYGPIDTQASRVIVPYLKKQGVDSLDHLIVSHRDSDHSGGLMPILSEFRVAKHWGFGGEPCRVGQRLQWPGEAVIDMLNGSGWDQTHPNASSCVLRIRYAGQTVLLAGDIPASTERELVRYWREGLKADIVAVAHHGSKTSTVWSWLKWVGPQVALISAGFDNRFGHPHPEVVDRLFSVGAQVVDTRIAGGVEIIFDHQGGRRVTTSRHGMTPFWAQLSQLTQLGVSPGTGILKPYKEDTP